ncbi:F0F1 ATP synthase subunit B [Arcobacter peruensis]|uniref:F0F1 ATP synthase subunit B n=1 Tax=Arcobacter peruensis TaxID=2320140 RepID=UPI000F078AA6|nr:F0F1 ATP synthase subunit B [Arcobacter peruensis]
MKRIVLLGLALAPLALFASSEGAVETDIVQRTVNFIIFAGILWYLLADKVKAFFADRSLSIQAELDKVQDALKASEDKVNAAKKQLEDANKLAAEIVENAKADIDSVKEKVSAAVNSDITNLERNLEEMIKVETSKAKREVVAEVLEELLKSDNIKLSQDELVNIVLKKVA